MNIDRYKELSGIEVVYYNEDKITNIMQDKTNCLESAIRVRYADVCRMSNLWPISCVPLRALVVPCAFSR